MKHGLDPQHSEWEEDEKHYYPDPPHHYIYLSPKSKTSQGFSPDNMGRGSKNESVTLKITLPPDLIKQLVLDRGEFIRAPFVIPPQFIHYSL